MRDLAVRTKLLVGFGIMVLLIASLVFISGTIQRALSERADKLINVANVTNLINQARFFEKNFLLNDTLELYQQAQQFATKLEEQAAKNARLLDEPDDIARMRQLQQLSTEYQRQLSEVAELNTAYNTHEERVIQLSSQLAQSIQELSGVAAEIPPASLIEINKSVLAIQLAEQQLLLSQRFNTMQPWETAVTTLTAQLSALNSLLESPIETTAYRDEMQRLASVSASFERNDAAMIEIARSIQALAEESRSDQVTAIATTLQKSQYVLAGAALLAIIIAVIAVQMTTKQIVGPLHDALGYLKRLAAGDLRAVAVPARNDELGQLMQGIANTATQLRGLMTEVSAGVEQLAVASEELSAVSEQTRKGVQEQMLGTDGVATAMHEMTATIKDVADHSATAADTADHADKSAVDGREVVVQTLHFVEKLDVEITAASTVIDKLNEHTNNISTVLDVIDKIADQTNLLALNAAIEAARAGESGRGFSVVAEEVRALALRTQQSTDEIEVLIANLQEGAKDATARMQRSHEAVQQSLQASGKAGTALDDITGKVAAIQQMIAQIAEAVQQHSIVSEDINENVTQIRDIASQSAAATSQISVTSRDLAALGADLKGKVGQFTLS